MKEMINVQDEFIQDKKGSWHSLKHVRSFHLTGCEKMGFGICIEMEHVDRMMSMGRMEDLNCKHDTREAAQNQLNILIEAIDYSRSCK